MTDVTLPALGVLIAGALTLFIAVVVLYRLVPFVVVCLFGQKATGRVVRVESGERSQARLRISFPAADGREVEYREFFQVKAKVGELLPVRYSRKNPDLATSGRLRLMLRDLFPLGIVLGICGPVAIASSIYVLNDRYAPRLVRRRYPLLLRADRFHLLVRRGPALLQGSVVA
ncbi:MAG TPA: DUF3592 domain-containing protein [Actinoallomurus sp.]|jgi:hypothetical protein|nr:DUF3592 domain-containing protein [Actinoallomurus sp.]